MKTATTHEAKTHLSRLLRDVQQGETVVILNNTVPVAKLTGVDAAATQRPPVGTITSAPVRCTDDAFAPLTERELGDWGL